VLASPAIVTRCELCELHAGEADGLTRQERLRRFGGPDSVVAEPDIAVAPGGESWHSFIERAGGALRDLVREHADETIVVFTHSGVIAASLAAFGGLSATSLFTAPPACTSLTEWRWRDGSIPRLFMYGDAGHLPASLRYLGTYS
jgi:probable phosphoglycerate mutase